MFWLWVVVDDLLTICSLFVALDDYLSITYKSSLGFDYLLALGCCRLPLDYPVALWGFGRLPLDYLLAFGGFGRLPFGSLGFVWLWTITF